MLQITPFLKLSNSIHLKGDDIEVEIGEAVPILDCYYWDPGMTLGSPVPGTSADDKGAGAWAGYACSYYYLCYGVYWDPWA